MPAKYERLVFASLLFLFSIAILYAGLQFLEKMAQKLELHKGWSRIRIIDKSTLNTFHPNMTPKEASVGGRSPYFTNSIGFRDSEVKLVARKHDGYRILFIGDSFTEGYKVKWADTFAGRIKFYFQNNNSSVEILNGGIGGFSTGQEYLRIKQFFDKGYSANLVILLVDFSDIY